MKIGMILDSYFPYDIRVEKEARTLLNAGFDVNLLCIAQKGKPNYENIYGLKVYRTNIPKGNIISKFWTVVNALIFIHPLWLNAINEFVKKNEIEVLHVHDLPLVNTALKVKRKLKIPVIADFHENYPEALTCWNKWTRNPIRKIINKILFSHDKWIRNEGKVCLKVNNIIVVTKEMKKRLIKMYNVPNKKVILIPNTEELRFIRNAKIYWDIVKRYKNRFVISYIGGFGPHRGLDIAIEGMTYIKKEIPNSLLLLVGRGSKDVENKLKKLVRKNDLEENVEFVGWQFFDKVYTYIYLSNIGLVPHNKNGHTDHTVPHKLFQYMMVGIPVVVSSCIPLKRIVRELNSGFFFEAGNCKSFSEKIIELYKHPEFAKILGKNGKKGTIQGEWNWENTSKSLVDLYKSF